MRRALLLALAASAAACVHGRAAAHDDVRGDGDKVAQARRLPAFERVELRTHLDVEVAEGPAQSVEVTIDRNLQDQVVTRVEGDRLIIDSRSEIRWRGEGKARISVPLLRGFGLLGSGDVRISGAAAARDVSLAVDGSGNLSWAGGAGELRAAIRGSGDVRLSGSARELSATISGSGSLDAQELTARGARLATRGSGDIRARLDGGALSAAVEGSGDILWSGTAQVESAAVSGSGSVRHR